MIGLAAIIGLVGGLVIGYLLGFPKGVTRGKEIIIEKKRKYDKSR